MSCKSLLPQSTTFTNALTGDDTLYIRMNLLKEHFNDLVTILKKCTKIRPLCFDEIYFGNAKPETSITNLYANTSIKYMPKDAYATFPSGSTQHLLWQRLGVSIGGSGGVSDFPDDIFTNSLSPDQTAIADVRWVTIANVKAKAAAMGFKFQYEDQFRFCLCPRNNSVWQHDCGRGYVQASKFRQLENADPKGSAFGASYISGLTESILDISHLGNNSNAVYARLVGVATNANPAVLFYLHDTSRDGHPSTGTRAKLAKKTVDSSGKLGHTITNLNAVK